MNFKDEKNISPGVKGYAPQSVFIYSTRHELFVFRAEPRDESFCWLKD